MAQAKGSMLGSLRLCLASVWTLCAVGCGAASALDSDLGEQTLVVGVGEYDSLELAQRVHDRVNEVRAEYGLSALAWQPGLFPAAVGHSRDMREREYFEHDSPEGEDFADRYEAVGFRCKVPLDPSHYLTGGENLHLGHVIAGVRIWSDGRREPYGVRSAQEVARRAVQGWLDSPPHRENLLRRDWRTQAIGVAIASDGRVYVTQNFC